MWKKLMIVLALIGLSLATALPVFAAKEKFEFGGFIFAAGACGSHPGETLSREEAQDFIESLGGDPDDVPDAGNICVSEAGGGTTGGDTTGGDTTGSDTTGGGTTGSDTTGGGTTGGDTTGGGTTGGGGGHNNNGGGGHNNNGGDGGSGLVASQESNMKADSGDVDQSFTITGGGANSNQCAGVQGVANTGNAQNQLDLLQVGSQADDFEFNEVTSEVSVSPTNTTECTQDVSQAATAAS